jgi:hypothetical protein
MTSSFEYLGPDCEFAIKLSHHVPISPFGPSAEIEFWLQYSRGCKVISWMLFR